jgi:hypothetical protein
MLSAVTRKALSNPNVSMACTTFDNRWFGQALTRRVTIEVFDVISGATRLKTSVSKHYTLLIDIYRVAISDPSSGVHTPPKHAKTPKKNKKPTGMMLLQE